MKTAEQVFALLGYQARGRTSLENVADVLAALTATTPEAAAQAEGKVHVGREYTLSLFDAYAEATSDGRWDERAMSAARLIVEALSDGLREHGATISTQPVQAQGEAWGRLADSFDRLAETRKTGSEYEAGQAQAMRVAASDVRSTIEYIASAPPPAVDRGLSEAQEREFMKRLNAASVFRESVLMVALKDIEPALRAALAASAPSQAEPAIPYGWALVPIKPTDEMLCAPDAGRLVPACGDRARNRWEQRDRDYTAMLLAAPRAPSSSSQAEPATWKPAPGTPEARAMEREHSRIDSIVATLGKIKDEAVAAPTPAGSCQASAADELVKRLNFLRIVTDEFNLKQIRLIANDVFASAAPPAGRTLTDAVIELLACKDLEMEVNALHFMGPLSKYGDDWKAVHDRMRADFLRRWPDAWNAVRAASSTTAGERE